MGCGGKVRRRGGVMEEGGNGGRKSVVVVVVEEEGRWEGKQMMEGRNEAQQSRAQQSTAKQAQHSTAQHWSQLQQQGEGGRAVERRRRRRRRERRMQCVRWQQRWEEALKASKKRNQSRSVELKAETAVRALCSVAILRWCLCLLGSFLAVREASPPRPGQWETCQYIKSTIPSIPYLS